MPRPFRAPPAFPLLTIALLVLSIPGAARCQDAFLEPQEGAPAAGAGLGAVPFDAAEALAITAVEARLAGDSLVASWSVAHLLDDAARRALESGVAAQIRFTVEAWKNRRFWFNGVAAERTISWVARLDRRGRRFALIGDLGGTIRGFESVADLETFLSYPMAAGLEAVADLSPGSSYHLTVRVEVTPLTIEAMQGVDYWMRGGDGGDGGEGLPGSGITRRLFGIVADLSGFGDRVASAKTPPFRLAELPAGSPSPPESD